MVLSFQNVDGRQADLQWNDLEPTYAPWANLTNKRKNRRICIPHSTENSMHPSLLATCRVEVQLAQVPFALEGLIRGGLLF